MAIKLLPREFAADTERLARFKREAKLLAQLSHPNVAGTFGLEQADGTSRPEATRSTSGPTSGRSAAYSTRS